MQVAEPIFVLAGPNVIRVPRAYSEGGMTDQLCYWQASQCFCLLLLSTLHWSLLCCLLQPVFNISQQDVCIVGMGYMWDAHIVTDVHEAHQLLFPLLTAAEFLVVVAVAVTWRKVGFGALEKQFWVHNLWGMKFAECMQCEAVARVADVIQIPAFLCQQVRTSLSRAYYQATGFLQIWRVLTPFFVSNLLKMNVDLADLLIAAAKIRRVINIEKDQFCASSVSHSIFK